MLSFFPRGVLDEILNLIESVSEGFPSYSFWHVQTVKARISLLSDQSNFCNTDSSGSIYFYMPLIILSGCESRSEHVVCKFSKDPFVMVLLTDAHAVYPHSHPRGQQCKMNAGFGLD